MDKKVKAKKPSGKVKISSARLSAFEILLKIEKEKAFSSILLPIYENKLAPNDRGLCHQLVLGSLRRQIYLDQIIRKFTGKKIDLEVRVALRLGLYQLLFLDKIPAYSAINESVNLVINAKKSSAKGFVNAILRRVTREKIEFEFTDPIERISIETSHPVWLIERWVGQFGIDETAKLASANNETPPLDFRLTAKATDDTNPNASNRAELFELAETGEIYFQDKGSQLVGRSVDLREGERFLDICAAPGSKLTQIATHLSSAVYAGDLHHRRVKIINESAKRQGLTDVCALQYDAEKALPFADETFDVVLLDAPCSGTGTIRHNPEIRHHLQEKDFADLADKQLNILQNASKVLKRFGRLIYSTCSLEIEENELVIDKFLAANKDFLVVKNDVYREYSDDKGSGRTFPHRDGMDGFFIVTLQKS